MGGGFLRCRLHVDNFPGSCVVQLFARFFLDCLRVALQRLDLLRVGLVLLLKSIDLHLQFLIFRTFRAVNDHAIRTEHHVEEEPGSQKNDACSGQPPARPINGTSEWLRFLNPALCESLRMRGSIHHSAQPILWLGDPNSGKLAYSKIHCLAAALSLVSSLAFAASE